MSLGEASLIFGMVANLLFLLDFMRAVREGAVSVPSEAKFVLALVVLIPWAFTCMVVVSSIAHWRDQ